MMFARVDAICVSFMPWIKFVVISRLLIYSFLIRQKKKKNIKWINMFSSSAVVLHIAYALNVQQIIIVRKRNGERERELFFRHTEWHRLSAQHVVDFLLFFSRSLWKYLLPFDSCQTLKYDSKDGYIDNMSRWCGLLQQWLLCLSLSPVLFFLSLWQNKYIQNI